MQNKINNLIFFISVLLSKAAFSVPIVEHTDWIEVFAESEHKSNILIYKDDVDQKTFWWFPYKLVMAKDPRSFRPVLNWSAKTEQPRISFAVNLEQYTEWTESALRKRISTAKNIASEKITLKAIQVQDARLMVYGYHNLSELGVTGRWFPMSDLFVSWMPETIYLDKEENDKLLREYELEFGYATLAINVSGVFQARLTPFRFGRKFESKCVVNALSELGSGNIRERMLLAVIARMDLSCVDSRSNRGREPNFDELYKAWLNELTSAKLILKGEDEKFAIGAAEDLLKYGDKDVRSFFYEFPEEIGLYPFALAVEHFNIRPM